MKNSIHDIYDNVIIAENFSIDFNNWMSVHTVETLQTVVFAEYIDIGSSQVLS